MAVTKVASVKLDLDGGNYTTAIKRIGDQTEQEARKAARSFSPLNAGLSRMTKDFSALGSRMGGMLKSALTFGGAFAFGASIKGAVDLNSQIQQFTQRVELSTGKTMDWREVQMQLRDATDDTKKSQEELLQTAERVFESTGNAEYSLGIIKAIGKQSQVTGSDMLALGDAGQLAFRKFGVTAEEFNNEVLPGITEKLAGGGLKVEDLQGKFALLATEAEALGFKGGKGFVQLLGLAKELDNELGESLVPGMKRLGEVLKSGTSQVRAIQGLLKKSRLKIDVDKQGLDLFRDILAKGPKGIEALQQSIRSPEARRTIDNLVKPFEEAFAKAREAGETPAEAARKGLDAFDARMFAFGKTLEDAETLQKRFNDRLRDDPGLKLRDSLNKLELSFQKPQMISALNKLSDNLPALAEAAASALDFIVDHPVLSGAVAVGGRAGTSFALGAAGEAIAARRAGTEAATSAAAGAAVTGAKGAPGAMGAPGKAGAPAANRGLIAGALIGEFAAVFGATTSLIETIEKEATRGSKLEQAGRTEMRAFRVQGNVGTAEQKQQAIDSLRREIQSLQSSQDTGLFGDMLQGLSDLSQTLGVTDKQQTGREIAKQQEARLAELVEKLESEIEGLKTKESERGRETVGGAPSEPREMAIKNPERLGEALGQRMARHIRDGELRVRMVNAHELRDAMGGGGGSAPPATRGPMAARTPTPSGGTGGA